MPFGIFGPITIQTKRGIRVTFVAGAITLPLTAWSLYQLFGSSPPHRHSDQGYASSKKLQPTDDVVNLSDR